MLSINRPIAASTIESAKPPSREDALTERLKNLRSQADSKAQLSSGAKPNRGNDGPGLPSIPNQISQPQLGPQIPGLSIGSTKVSPTEAISDDADPFLDTDDQTLEELLADLESDQQWLDEVAAEEEQQQHLKVTALLKELGDASATEQELGKSRTKTASDDEDNDGGDEGSSGDNDEDDDDSENEQITRETDDTLAQVLDQVEWEKSNEPPSHPETKSATPRNDTKPTAEDNNESAAAQRSNEDDPLNLPAVPSDLQDQPNAPDFQDDDADFAASITSRMAALKVDTASGPNLPSVPTSDLDELGLPAVPTFAPSDRPAPGLIKRVGYTDEDQKTWCIVCLEDGAIKCLDCDGDIYCARCWKEMHVGPTAGYDERGHRWEKFVRPR